MFKMDTTFITQTTSAKKKKKPKKTVTSFNKKKNINVDKVHSREQEQYILKSKMTKQNVLGLKNKNKTTSPLKNFSNKVKGIEHIKLDTISQCSNSQTNKKYTNGGDKVNKNFKGKHKFSMHNNSTSQYKVVHNTSNDNKNAIKPKKRKFNESKNLRNTNISIIQNEFSDEDYSNEKKNQKLVKRKKLLVTSISNNLQEPKNVNLKKLKDTENLTVRNTGFDSEDSEDVEIRKEIQSCSIYKNIQKLLHENPSLNCGFSNNFATTSEEGIEVAEEESSMSSDENVSSELGENNDDFTTALVEYSPIKNNSKQVSNTSKKEKHTDYMSLYHREGTLCRDHADKSIKINASTSLKNKAREKLQAAKFRFLNEKLYTESGKESFMYFQTNQDEFHDYHVGYSLQVSKWPMNPVDKIIHSIKQMNETLVIADMGCGDAKIAKILTNCSVHSFDLVALNDCVTPCNISKVPLPNESVDVVVFCLSLMGTNLKDYIQEAHRITKLGGALKIAEVESRIENLDHFIRNIQCLGFTLKNKDVEHKLFVFLDFKKEKKKKLKSAKGQDIVLKPCLYKKR